MNIQGKSEHAHLSRYLRIFTCKIGHLLTFTLFDEHSTQFHNEVTLCLPWA